MKLCVNLSKRVAKLTLTGRRNQNSMMSDYEVTLVNDNMQEFFVKFYGPKDSM